MYCSKCGAEIAEGSRFCPKCGTLRPKSRDFKLNKPIIGRRARGILGIVLVAVILLIVILNITDMHNTPKSIAKTAMRRTLKFQYDRVIDCYPDELSESMEKEAGVSLSMLLSLKESHMNQMVAKANKDGVDLDKLAGCIRFDVESVKNYTAFDLAQLRNAYADTSPKLVEKISKAAKVTMTVTGKGTIDRTVMKGQLETTEEMDATDAALEYLDMQLPMTVNATVVKMKGNWYLLTLEDQYGNDLVELF